MAGCNADRHTIGRGHTLSALRPRVHRTGFESWYYFVTVDALAAELIELHQHASAAASSMGTHDLPCPVGRGDLV
jgi:hypothetical protein